MKKKIRLALLLVVVTGLIWFAFCLPDDLFNKPQSRILLDRDGQLLAASIASDGQWRFPVPDSVPVKLKLSLLEFEDRHFYSHPGVHLPSIVRAAKQNYKADKIVSGGSTITMQLVRLSRNNPPRSISEKLLEVILATRIEIKYSKEEILKMYCAHAPFGGNVVGIEAASWRYFGRAPHELSWAESATLAVLPNAPSLIFPGKNQEALVAKRNRLLDRMLESGFFDEATCELAKLEPVPGPPHKLPQHALHLLFADYSENGRAVMRRKTHLNAQIQVLAENAVQRHTDKLSGNFIRNAAAIVVHVPTGEVIAYVGNVKTENAAFGDHVDIIRSKRSTGSILKPFLYAAMLESGELMPTQLIPDVPVRLGNFQPDNFSEGYDGAVNADKALARSLNVPAVTMLNNYGVERFHHITQKLRLTSIDKNPDHYGLTLVLGGAESTLWEISRAYASMSSVINSYPSKTSDTPLFHQEVFESNSNDVKSEEHIFSAAACFLTFEALQKVNRPEEEMGWESYSSSRKIAWKTGTSFGFRDAWAVGSTPEYVVGVWVGNASGEGRPGLTGTLAAAPLLFELMDQLPQTSWYATPWDDLDEVVVCKHSGYLPSQICPETDTILVPHNKPVQTLACPYHKMIHLETKSGLQVNQNCVSASEISSLPWFTLPAVEAWYFQRKTPWYQPEPSWKEGCNPDESSAPMQLINQIPANGIFIPTDIDGKKSSLVLEAAHRQNGRIIYWHIDDQFIAQTTDIHSITVNPTPGIHELVLIDDMGNMLRKRFRIREM